MGCLCRPALLQVTCVGVARRTIAGRFRRFLHQCMSRLITPCRSEPRRYGHTLSNRCTSQEDPPSSRQHSDHHRTSCSAAHLSARRDADRDRVTAGDERTCSLSWAICNAIMLDSRRQFATSTTTSPRKLSRQADPLNHAHHPRNTCAAPILADFAWPVACDIPRNAAHPIPSLDNVETRFKDITIQRHDLSRAQQHALHTGSRRTLTACDS
jgi:hypothetical protein